MKLIRDALDKAAPLFEEGGKFHKFHAFYEAPDTLLFTPSTVTKGRTHVRDAIDLKRMMVTVVVSLMPAVAMALYNTGLQANRAIAMAGEAAIRDDFNTVLYKLLMGVSGASGAELLAAFDPSNHLANVLYGMLYFVPVWITTFAVGGHIEMAVAVVRKHEVNEGFLVSGFLFPLILPPTIPLWQVALGIAFGVIIGKEVFGGTGMNVLNPALTGRAFLFFAYPGQISGDAVWVAANNTDAFSGATWLGKAALDANALSQASWLDAFLGFVPGSMGETSALACLLGAGILITTRVGSWRTMAGVVVGTIVTTLLLNAVGSDTNPMMGVPFWWHMVLGGWAFGTVFMATDPVSSAFTDLGRLLYGFGIGVMVVLVRVVNPAYPEGMMLAILFMNLFAPLFDHFVVQANIQRRLARSHVAAHH
jgi:Na+-transporting NADH:ubiquinone oxidoreductase subunit B